jgi:hypothetical protein
MRCAHLLITNIYSISDCGLFKAKYGEILVCGMPTMLKYNFYVRITRKISDCGRIQVTGTH